LTELSKIKTAHLRRNAYVYVRQSTPTQVLEHTESLERQYELAERAHALGWAPHQVIVIDSDLGRSGADSTARDGFKQLVADVGLGGAGIILGIEVSRLARNNADWYHLLDLCALADTLIADQDGLYHPADFNDRLVLGLKGTMSEAELHLIRGRLTAGLRHKAAKGELRQGLPIGFDYDEDGNIVMSPDEAVVEAIATIFRRFDELQSARQVMLSLQEDGLLIPRRRNGSKRVFWARPSYPAIHDFLTNPCYAGAFVFGRNRTEKRVGEDGRVTARTVGLPRDEWEVLIPEHHQGFVTWERYEAIQDQLRANWHPPRGHGGGAAREGSALLQGRIRCGRCGRMMQTGYSGTKGNCPRYVCNNAHQLYGSAGMCQSLGGRLLEQRVVHEIFKVLQPAAFEATVAALKEAEAHHAQRTKAFALAVERARFEADRARRQFDQVEPENRLVGRTLERAWEEKLAALRRAESDLAAQQARRPTPLTEEEIAWVERAGADVRAIFDAPTTTWRERKQLVRALISEVVVTVNHEARSADLTIVWEGGATTSFEMALRKTGGHFRATDEGHRRFGAQTRSPPRRQDDRHDPVPAEAQDGNGPALHAGTGQEPATHIRHLGVRCTGSADGWRCNRDDRGPGRGRVRCRSVNRLSLDQRGLHRRRADHPGSAMANPRRRRAPREDRGGRTRGVAVARRGGEGPGSSSPNGFASGPTR
jgi:DNA invertase Pin-like site-specific DNA recombinase